MSLKKDYVLNLDKKIIITITLNICWTYLMWLNEPEPRLIKENTYVDGDVCITVDSGKPMLIGTEQSMGNLMDFLNSPVEFINSNSGLLVDGIYSDECAVIAKKDGARSLMVIEFTKSGLETIELPITKTVRIEFDRVKDSILQDLHFMFAEINAHLVKHFCISA